MIKAKNIIPYLDMGMYMNKKYGMLTIIGYSGYVSYKHIVIVKCDCGVIKTVRLQSLENGGTVSCKCYRMSLAKTSKNNLTHGLTGHTVYALWAKIKDRCYNISCPCYMYYGGSGVVMCDEWLNDCKAFYDWCMANGWRKGLQIDKDIKYREKHGLLTGKMYSPEYCCFVTHKVNSDTRRNSVRYAIDDGEFTLTEICAKYNLNYKALFARIKNGWDLKCAIETPPLKNFKKKIYVEDLHGNYIGTYNGCRDVQNKLGVKETTVHYCVSGKTKNNSTYKFKYI